MLNNRIINQRLNILLLHKSEDNSGIKCIRVVWSRELKQKIFEVLKLLGFRDKKGQINFITRGVPWVTNEGLAKDWMRGRNNIPLILIKNICRKLLSSSIPGNLKTKLLDELLEHSRLLTTSRSNKKVSIPLKINDKLLHIIGVIVGDGSLPKTKDTKGIDIFTINIEKSNEPFIRKIIKKCFLDVFQTEGTINKRLRKNKQTSWKFEVISKPLVRFFTELFDIPRGKKSHIVRMPSIIRNLKPIDRVPFIVGIMDTDWGHHHWRFGTGSASRKLIEDVRKTLEILLKSKISHEHQGHASFMWLKKKQIQKLNTLLNNRFQLKNTKRIELIQKILEPRGVAGQAYVKTA